MRLTKLLRKRNAITKRMILSITEACSESGEGKEIFQRKILSFLILILPGEVYHEKTDYGQDRMTMPYSLAVILCQEILLETVLLFVLGGMLLE